MHALQLYAFQDAAREKVLEELGLEPPGDAEGEVQGPGAEAATDKLDPWSQVEERGIANRTPKDRNKNDTTQDQLQRAEGQKGPTHDAFYGIFYGILATYSVIYGSGHREEARRAVGPRTIGAEEPRRAPVGEAADSRSR